MSKLMSLRVVVSVFAFVLLIQSAVCQKWVEERTYVAAGQATPRFDGLLTNDIKGKVGDFVWFQTQQGYSEAYAGITYAPKPWIQFALGTGLEEDKRPLRFGSYVWVGRKKNSGLAAFEDGGSGFWYKVEANSQIRTWIGLGLLAERFHGVGPKFEFSIPVIRAKVWTAALVEDRTLKPVAGLRFTF
jgi:hypothetical protein